MVPFEVRVGMEGERTQETDLTMCHQVLEEGDKFESSILRMDRCYFVALLRVATHLLRVLWNYLSLPSVEFALLEGNASCFMAMASPQDSMYQGWKDGYDN